MTGFPILIDKGTWNFYVSSFDAMIETFFCFL